MSFDYRILLYIFFGVLPSLTWLSYYLRKDSHPESNSMVLKIFLWGALITIPVFFVQIGLQKLLDLISLNMGLPSLNELLRISLPHLNPLSIVIVAVYWFLVISFTEEIFKYFVVKLKVVNSPHLDEPLDIMLYMVIAALGFAALENILYLFAPAGQMSFNQLIDRTLIISFIRFIGATFLHTLCSAVIGYAMAISFCDQKNRLLEFAAGIFMATLLHGLYDFSIMTLNGYLKVGIPVIVILTLAFLVFSGFEKLKKMKGVTELNRPVT